MTEVLRRGMSLLLALVTVVTLLPAMGLQTKTEAEKADQTITIANVSAKEKSPASYSGAALTYADVEAIVNDYWKTINALDRLYWNAGIRGNNSKLEKATFYNTVTSKGCHIARKGTKWDTTNISYEDDADTIRSYHSYGKTDTKDGVTVRGCTSNGYKGVSPYSGYDAQCSGFAAYMGYVVFKEKAKVASGCYTKITGDAVLSATIKPGDIIRNNGHSYFIWKVKDGKATTIECNDTKGSCRIYTNVRSISSIRSGVADRSNSKDALFSAPSVPSSKSYDIVFDMNVPNGAANATGTMENQKHWVGGTAKLTANAYKINNYVFQGWNTQKNGRGASYGDKASVTDLATEDGATVTLYAQWMNANAYDYLSKSTAYGSSLQATAVGGMVQNIKTLPCSWSTFTESKTVRALKKGETLTVTGLYKNPEGNYWYKVKADSDGAEGFVFHEHIEVWSENNVRFNVKLATYNIKKGKGCEISGSVSSAYGLTSLKGVLDDSDPKTAAQSETISSGFSKIQDTNIDNKLGFGKLSRGKGTLTLTAEMKNNYRYDADKNTHVRVTETKVIDFTVVAQYNVKYNANSPDSVTNMPGNQKKTDGKDITLSANIPVRSGYTFLGWATDKNATKAEYKAGATLSEDTASGDMVLYAVWTKGQVNTYSVTYDANGGTGAPAAQTKQKNKDLTLSKAVPTRKGYTFNNWSDGNTTYKPGGTYKKNEDAILVAQWKPIEYTICYDKNGGSGTMAGTSAVYDKESMLSENGFTRSGYEFVGWNTKRDGSGTMYQPGDKVKNLVDEAGVDKVIFAIWKQAEASGGAQVTADEYMKKCTAYFSAGTLKITADNAWFKSLPCSGSTCAASANVYGSAVPKGTAMTVTGLYKNSEGNYWYKAAWNGKNGYIYAAQASFTAAAADFVISDAKLPENLQEGDGFGIRGTVTSNIGTPFRITGTISDCNGQQDTHTVTSNGSSYDLSNKAFDNNISFGVLAVGECKYQVKAWATCHYSTNGTELLSKEVSKTLIDHSFRVVAVEHTLTFLSGHDQNKTVKTLKVKDQGSFTIPDIGYQREGYEFLGYTVKRLKDGKIYAGGKWQTEKELAASGTAAQIYVVGRKLTLNASWTTGNVTDSDYQFTGIWTAKQGNCVLRYDASGFDATNMPEDQNFTMGVPITLSAQIPACEGLVFKGWFTENNGEYKEYRPGDSVTFENVEETVTLWALWEQSAFMVTYASDLPAENIPASQYFAEGQSVTLSSTIPVGDGGFVFRGWSANIDGDTVEYQPGDTVTFTGSVTLWALWEIAPIQVYDVNADKYWEINPYSYEVTVVDAFDTSDLAHITITLDPSEGIKSNHADIRTWYDNYDFCIGPLGPGDGYFMINGNKFDFYVTKGIYYYCRNGANGANSFDFGQSADLTFHICRLTFDASCDGNSNISDTEFVGNYPYSGEMGSYPEREGYTLIGWSGSANAVSAEYPVVFPWAFLEDTTLYAVWEANS